MCEQNYIPNTSKEENIEIKEILDRIASVNITDAEMELLRQELFALMDR